MSSAGDYWNPVLETLPPERLRALQVEKFKRILQWTYDRSRFHRSLYDEAGITPTDIRSFEDLRRVPTVDKAMMRAVQGKEPFPYGDVLCVPLSDVTAYRQTSGTTGQPVYQADSWRDWEWWAECWAYLLWAQGYRPEDRVYIPFAYNVFVAFWAGHYGAEKIGCEVIPGGGLDTKSRLSTIQELRPTAVMGTPTYMLRMAETARHIGIDLARSSVARITCAGEPGASIPSTKQRLEAAWGAKVFDHAGATEIGAWAYECAHQPGGIHVNEAMFLVEVEAIDSGEPITEPGRRGKLIVTALDREAQPCVRFDSKDVGEWAEDPCPCGRTFRLLKGGIVGRADDITNVKGVLLAPSAIEEVVRGIDGLGDEYEVIVEREGDLERISLKVELLPEARGNCDAVEARLAEQLRLKTHLRFALEFHEYGSLPRYPVKAARFKDLRS